MGDDLTICSAIGSACIATLQDRAAELAACSYGAGTRRAYASAWNAYEDWCRSVGRPALSDDPAQPGDPGQVALYVAARSEDLSVSSIGVAVAAIAEAHRLAGVPLNREDERLVRVLAGVRRSKGTAPRRKAAPAVPDVLRRFLATRKPHTAPAGARDRAMLLLAFGGALRRSELVALRVGDVEIEGRGVALAIRRSKTDQDGKGATVAILANRADPEFCALTALVRWLEHRRRGADGGSPDRPLFCAVSKGGTLSGQTLSDVTVSRLMKDAADACGMDPDAFSGHSARRGYMTAAAQMGVSLSDMMAHSRHKSADVALGYIAEAGKWDSPALNVFS